MSYFTEDVHRRVTTKIREIIPDYIESEYPQLVAFILAYYEFLEQYDDLPVSSLFNEANGVLTIQTNNSTVIGSNTSFTTAFSTNQRFKVGSDYYTVKSVTNNTSLVISDIPVRTYFANTYYPEINKSIRQSKGALRQVLSYHDIDATLDDFMLYFKNTYVQDIPTNGTAPSTLIKRILDFYQARGSEDSYRFLFRALFGKEIAISYPREQIFTTSDNQYEAPSIIKLNMNTVVGDVNQLISREIVGLTSNAQAMVSTVTVGFEGNNPTAVLSVENLTVNKVVGGILLESGDPMVDGRKLIATAYGTPPDGISTSIYNFNLATEDSGGGVFLAGETISSIPVNDPIAITGTILGTVTGFTVESTGQNYAIGEKVTVPYGFNGGYGAVGKISSLISTDILSINVISGGDGYYTGLTMEVDNSGTGGYGLSGYVSRISPGNILTEAGDSIIFVALNETNTEENYYGVREAINYYESKISIADALVGNILLNSDNTDDDGDGLLFEIGANTYSARRNDQEIILNTSDWSSGNIASALYLLNLQTSIGTLTTKVNYLPWYVNGVQREIGEISEISLISAGADYVIKPPVVYVSAPTAPTADILGTNTLSTPYYTFMMANLEPVLATGQISKIDVISAGSGYTSAGNTFFVNSTTSTTVSGFDGELGLVVAGITKGQGRFRNTKSMASGDMFIQSIDRYQPFAYVLSVEENLMTYKDIIKKLLHPAGGLLLAQRTVTNDLDLSIDVSTTVEVS